MTKSKQGTDLRDLAGKIKELTIHHMAATASLPAVNNCGDHLYALAGFAEIKAEYQAALEEAAKVAKGHLGSSHNVTNTINFIARDIMALGEDND